MRFVFLLVMGFFLWAGTVTINYPNQSPSATESSAMTCSGREAGNQLVRYIQRGMIESLRDNGRILTIGLPSQWESLTVSIQRKVHSAVTCYAKTQKRQVQYFATQGIR